MPVALAIVLIFAAPVVLLAFSCRVIYKAFQQDERDYHPKEDE